jgi:hypothetical protein
MSRPVEIPREEDDEWTAGANEIVNMLFHYIGESGKSYEQVEDEAGLGGKTLKSWRGDGMFPQLDSILRALHAVGYTLVTVRQEDSAFAQGGYFAMQDAREHLRCKKEGLPPTTVFGTPEWEEASSFDDWPLPTPREIAADNAAVPSPEERRKLDDAFEERRKDKRRKLFELRSAKRRRTLRANSSTTPVVERREKRKPSDKAKTRTRLARTRDRLADRQ